MFILDQIFGTVRLHHTPPQKSVRQHLLQDDKKGDRSAVNYKQMLTAQALELRTFTCSGLLKSCMVDNDARVAFDRLVTDGVFYDTGKRDTQRRKIYSLREIREERKRSMRSPVASNNRKITPEEVEAIRSTKDTMTAAEWARIIGVDRRTVSRVRTGETYKPKK